MNERIKLIISQLLSVLAIASPGQAATVAVLRALLAAGTELYDLIEKIKRDDPGAWAEVSADFKEDLAAFRASVERQKA